MQKVYYSLMMFALTALCFPIMYDSALDANLTNTGLDLIVVNFPVVLLVITALIPVFFFVQEKNR